MCVHLPAKAGGPSVLSAREYVRVRLFGLDPNYGHGNLLKGGNMSTYTEEKLLDLALQVIQRNKLNWRMASLFDVGIFEREISRFVYQDDSRLRKFLAGLSRSKNADIVSLSIDKPTEFRISNIRKLIDFDKLPLRGDALVGTLAGAIIFAAIFDILATEAVIRIETDPCVRCLDYNPRPKMREFVWEHRFKKYRKVT